MVLSIDDDEASAIQTLGTAMLDPSLADTPALALDET
jgi:hypothetical protein